MNHKIKYYELFGLNENASKHEIRKAYRKLAMKYHPDKNPDPKAHQVFIDLTEAYQYLIDDSEAVKPQPKNRKEQSFEDRKKEAEIRFKQQKIKEQREQDFYFKRMTSGKSWKFFTFCTYASVLISFILLLEPMLPTRFESHRIMAFSTTYNGLISPDQVVCVKTNQDLKLFIVNPYLSFFSTNPDIQVERSLIFHNPVRVWYQNWHYSKYFDVDFSAINLYPSISAYLLIPFFTLYFRRKSYWFTLGYYFSLYLVFPFAAFLLFTQDRWIHLLSLGFI